MLDRQTNSIPRQSYENAAMAMGDALDNSSLEPNDKRLVCLMVLENPLKFRQMRLKLKSATIGVEVTDKAISDGIEPSDLFLDLLTAISANDGDVIRSIAHGLPPISDDAHLKYACMNVTHSA